MIWLAARGWRAAAWHGRRFACCVRYPRMGRQALRLSSPAWLTSRSLGPIAPRLADQEQPLREPQPRYWRLLTRAHTHTLHTPPRPPPHHHHHAPAESYLSPEAAVLAQLYTGLLNDYLSEASACLFKYLHVLGCDVWVDALPCQSEASPCLVEALPVGMPLSPA